MAVSPDRFRRLAMSSPWRWRELTLLWQDGVDEPVRVAVGRPGRLRVEHLDGTVISQIDGPARVPGRVSWLRLGAALFETERSGVSVDPPRGLPEEEFFVRLDAQTAGCVHVSRLDGTDPRVRLDVAIEQVA